MKQCYGYYVRLQEKSKYPYHIILEIMSIAVALYFVMMFLSKVEDTQQSIQFFNEQQLTENVVVELTDFSSDFAVSHTISQKIEEYINIDEKTYFTQVLEVDSQYPDFYPLSVREDIWQKFSTQPNYVILASNVARSWNKAVGDTINLRGEIYTILDVVVDPWHKDKILIGRHNISSSVPLWRKKCQVTLSENNIHLVDSQLPYKRLRDIFQEEITSLNSFLVFITMFSLLFIAIAVVNIYLIFKTSIQREMQSRKIKWLYGETRSQFVTRVCIEYVMTAIVAFHVSIILYYLLLPLVPVFFYFKLIKSVYISELLLVLITSFILALVLSSKQVLVKYEKIWRG